jgi:hypothetical protein
MNTEIHRIVTAHCTNHIERGEADAVWGEALCSVGDFDRTALLPPAEWRIISFDGRRGNQITQRTKEYASQSAAESAFNSKWRAKQREGYDSVNWTNSYYGLISAIRDIDTDFFDMVVTESTRVGMDLRSPLWLSVSGLTGATVPRQELIDNFNRSRGGNLREQTEASGRFARDPAIGAHVYLWNGVERDPNFERCGVCSKKLSKHQRLVVNYRGRLARHIWRPSQGNQWNCAICNLQRDGEQGRLVHSQFNDQVEWVSGPQAQQISVETNPSEAEIQTSTIYVSDIEPVEIDPEVERAVASDLLNRIDRIEERIFVNGSFVTGFGFGSPANNTPRTRPATDKSKPKPSQPPKPESTSHERTGGLLDFDI